MAKQPPQAWVGSKTLATGAGVTGVGVAVLAGSTGKVPVGTVLVFVLVFVFLILLFI
eukprot:COSAG01_NODE_6546_length_3613_cov_16.807057_1_plen_56_part_10